jgi:hypothetical protein
MPGEKRLESISESMIPSTKFLAISGGPLKLISPVVSKGGADIGEEREPLLSTTAIAPPDAPGASELTLLI